MQAVTESKSTKSQRGKSTPVFTHGFTRVPAFEARLYPRFYKMLLSWPATMLPWLYLFHQIQCICRSAAEARSQRSHWRRLHFVSESGIKAERPVGDQKKSVEDVPVQELCKGHRHRHVQACTRLQAEQSMSGDSSKSSSVGMRLWTQAASAPPEHDCCCSRSPSALLLCCHVLPCVAVSCR